MPQELELFTVPGFAGVKFAIVRNGTALKAIEDPPGPDGARAQSVLLPAGVSIDSEVFKTHAFLAHRKLRQLIAR